MADLKSPPPRWTGPSLPDPASTALLAEALGLPEALCRLLAIRGYADPETAKGFLRPRVEHFHPAGQLADADRAADRIAQAVRGGESILVHGDYDVDGIAGTALLTRFLRDLGARAEGFVPNRTRDGYDLSSAGLEAAKAVDASLLITVDCGIVAHEPIAEAVKAGIDVIVTDHHKPADSLPAAFAVVNPNRRDCDYPNPALCGTGVAFKLCDLLAREFGVAEEALFARLDLVALATIADLVPLEGENRALVRFGLRAIGRTERPGLRALVEACGLELGAIDEGRVGWVLGPRINAVGRIGDAGTALRLLLSEDRAESRSIAAELERANTERREIDAAVLERAWAMVEARFDPSEDSSVVLDGEGWHPGVIGIVASRIVERVHRPVLLIAMDGGAGRGSGRSIPGFDLHAALSATSHHLTRFGGHAQAAGFEIEEGEIGAFRQAFEQEAHSVLRGRDLRRELMIDLELDPRDTTLEFVDLLRHMGPFGRGNPSPVFVSRGLELAAPAREVGKGHLKLGFQVGSRVLDAIGFGLAARRSPQEVSGGRWDAVYHLEDNTYRGRTQVQVRLLDLAPTGGGGGA